MNRPQSRPSTAAPAAPPAASGPVRYATRNHAFSREVTWALDGTILTLDDGQGPPRLIPLESIRALHLDFAPNRAERHRYRCRLALATSEILFFYNRRYRGLYDFSATNPEYVAFVRALCTALGRRQPGCRFVAGAGPLAYAVNLTATAFVFLCFGLIAWFLARVNLTWLVAIKLLILIFFVPALIQWVARNRPRHFQADAIPADLLPAVPPTTAPP